MTTAVTAPPISCGHVPSGPSSLPTQRRPRILVVAPQRRLAVDACEPGSTDAGEASGTVEAATAIQTRSAGAVVQIDSAEASGESNGADAGEAIDAIQAGGAVCAWFHQAIVHVGLTA